MKLSHGELIKIVLRKLGVTNPEQYDTVLDTLTEEIEEDVEGDLRQRLGGLKTVEDFKKDKPVINQLKAEFLNGLEKQGLSELVGQLDEIDQAEYQRKDGATNKVKYLIESTVKQKTKSTPNNKAEEDSLRAKVVDFETKIANGEFVSKAEIETLKGKINALHEGSFKDKVLSKLSSKVVEHLNDPDFLDLKVRKFMNEKGISHNHEDGFFYKQVGDEQIKATKHDKTVEPMNMDDLVSAVLASDEKLVKKSDVPPKGEINITVPPVVQSTNAGVSKLQQHKQSIAI